MKMVAKAAVFNLITLLVRHVINFGVVIYTARNFGPVSVGALSFFTIVTGIFSMVGTTGVVSAFVHTYKEHPETTFSSALVVSFLYFLASWAFFSVAIFFFDAELFLANVPLFWILGTVMIMTRSFSSVFEGSLLARLLFSQQSLCELASYIIALILLACIVLVWGGSIWFFIFYYVIQSLVYAILVFSIVGKVSVVVDKVAILNFLKISFLQVCAQVSNVFATNADNVLIAKILGASMLGFYSRAYQLLLLPSVLIGQVVQKIAFPLLRSGSAGFSSSTFLEVSVKMMLFPCIVVSWVFYYFSSEIVFLIYGLGWDVSSDVLKIFSFFVFPRVFYKVAESVILSAGKVKFVAWINFFYALAMISVVLFSLINYDVYAMALAVGFVVVVYTIILSVFAGRFAGVSSDNFKSLRFDALFLMLFFITLLVDNFFVTSFLFIFWCGHYFFRILGFGSRKGGAL